MDRNELVRAHFEAYRDLTWAETLEPRLREQSVDPPTIATLREAWKHHTESRDWAWWQRHVQRYSNGELDDMRMDCIDRLDALGMLRWQQDRAMAGEEKFARMLTEKPTPAQDAQEHTRGRKGRSTS